MRHAATRRRRGLRGRPPRCAGRPRRARRARLPGARVPRRAHDRARAAAAAARSGERLRRAAARSASSRCCRSLDATRRPPRQQPRRRESARRGGRDRRHRAPPAHPGQGRRGHRRRRARRARPRRADDGRRRAAVARTRPIVSANAYLGAEALLPALASGADIVVTGRVADPSLFVAPLDARVRLGARRRRPARARQRRSGHLLECAGQLCGGYFADPGRKDDPRHGAPRLSVRRRRRRRQRRRSARSTAPAAASRVATATEQLLYEVTDPHGYLTPDVIADFSSVTLTETAPRPRRGARRARTRAPVAAQGERRLSRGLRRRRRDRLRRHQRASRARSSPREILRERLAGRFSRAAHRPRRQHVAARPRVRQRRASVRSAAARGRARDDRARRRAIVGDEVEALYTNGPAGGGGTRKYVNEQIGIVSTLIDRARVDAAA